MLKSTLATFVVVVSCLAVSGEHTPVEDQAIVPPTTSKSNILFLAPVGSKSHKNFYYGLIEAMANDGHQVTLLTPYHPARTISNVREVVLEENDISKEMANPFTDGAVASIGVVMTFAPNMCIKSLTSEKTVALLEQKFDLVFVSMFFCECFLPHVHAMKVPFVFVNPAEMFGPMSAYRMGNPLFPSFEYHMLLHYKVPMTFFQRLIVTVVNTIGTQVIDFAHSRMDSKGRSLGLFPPNSPSLVDISKNASLMIANSFRLAEHPRPYMPNILLAGGIHCRDAKPLPQDLEDWVASSGTAGVILFSLGSAVRPSDIPEDIVRLLASVFKSLPQKVLWKYDLDALPGGTPPNVRLIKWAPQQDLLGHPRVLLMITHGGLFTTQEASYHGVPVLGLPLFGDQNSNMATAEAQGWGRKLSWPSLTFDNVRSAIVELIEDPEKRANVARREKLMRDRMVSPAAEVAWWINYLLRTKGASHLRSGAADMSWYEVYNTDVWLTLLCCAVLLLWLLLKLVTVLWRCCCGNRKTEKKEKWH